MYLIYNVPILSGGHNAPTTDGDVENECLNTVRFLNVLFVFVLKKLLKILLKQIPTPTGTGQWI